MVLGLLLARAGIQVTVLEKHGDFLRDFRGDTVHPSTLTLLDDLGLYQRFEALPHSEVETVGFTTASGHVITVADFRRLRVPHPVLGLVPQWNLLDLLADAARPEPSFSLRMNTAATGLLRSGDLITGVRYEGPDGLGELRADLTVACDGRTSVLRRAAGLVPHEYPVPFDVGWFRLNAVGSITYQLTPRFAPGMPVILIPREGYYQSGVLIAKGSTAKLKSTSLEAFKAQVARAVPEGSVDSIESWDDVKLLDVRLDRLPRWHRPGFLCIGDAAHAMSPAGGVGINLAIADAVAAARLLAHPLRTGDVTEADLAAVQKRRQVAAIGIQTFQRLIHRGIRRVLAGCTRSGPPIRNGRLGAILSRVSAVTSIGPAYLVGVGIRPERAPDFARRPP